jgi:hypothetical protein
MGCNGLADAGALDSTTRRINNRTNEKDNRQRHWAAAREVV